MTCGKSVRWKDEDMADAFTRQAVQFIERNQGKPFLLYFASHDTHVPRVPHPRFAGTTGMGPRGDAVAQLVSFAALTGQKLDAADVPDSFDVFSVLLQKLCEQGRSR
jgi:hypothetical protein